MSKHKLGIYEKYVKRPQDFLCALAATVVLSPVILITAVLIRIKLGAPVIFTQERPGKDGKIFKLYKFRTMTNAKDKNGELLSDEVRLTKFGKERYKEGFKDLPVIMNPYDEENSEPNYWLSCMLINPEAMCKQVRGEQEALYISEPGKTCPTEILDKLAEYNAEGRPIWKPMHMQPIYRMNGFVTREGNGRAKTNAYISGGAVGKDGRPLDVGMDIFHRGLCLPSDNKMTEEQQAQIVEIIRECFRQGLE